MKSKKYDYSKVEQIAGIEFKYSMIAVGVDDRDDIHLRVGCERSGRDQRKLIVDCVAGNNATVAADQFRQFDGCMGLRSGDG